MKRKIPGTILFLSMLAACSSGDASKTGADTAQKKLTVVVKPSSSYVMQGEKYKAEIYLAGDFPGNDSILVNGATVTEKRTDAYVVEAPADAIGLQTISGTIEINGAGGGKQTLPFETQYVVAPPAVAICPKYLLAGIDNPIAISAAGFPAVELQAESDNGTLRAGQGAGEYLLKPGHAGKCVVTVKKDGQVLGSQVFEVIERK